MGVTSHGSNGLARVEQASLVDLGYRHKDAIEQAEQINATPLFSADRTRKVDCATGIRVPPRRKSTKKE